LGDRRRQYAFFQALGNPFHQVAQQLVNDRLTPLSRRLKRCSDSVARSSWVALVTEERIRCKAEIPVTPDTAKLMQLIIFKAQVPLDIFVKSLGGPTGRCT